MAPDRDFAAVLQAAREGDEGALTELYRALFPRLVRYVAAVEPTEAEDLACETWLHVVGALRRFRGDEGALRGLAFTIARRRVLDARRQRARRRTGPRDPSHLIEVGPVGDVESEALSSLGTDWAIKLVTSSLPRDQAEVVLLRVIGDLSTAIVATILGKRPGHVRVLQHRALHRLARVLERQDVTR